MKITTNDFIFFGLDGFCYLPQTKSIYKKICCKQEYFFICKPKKRPIIKILNKEFNHRKITRWV